MVLISQAVLNQAEAKGVSLKTCNEDFSRFRSFCRDGKMHSKGKKVTSFFAAGLSIPAAIAFPPALLVTGGALFWGYFQHICVKDFSRVKKLYPQSVEAAFYLKQVKRKIKTSANAQNDFASAQKMQKECKAMLPLFQKLEQADLYKTVPFTTLSQLVTDLKPKENSDAEIKRVQNVARTLLTSVTSFKHSVIGIQARLAREIERLSLNIE